MPLIVLRLIFFLVAIGLAVSVVQTMPEGPDWMPFVVFGGILGFSAVVATVDALFPKKPLDVISSVYFGLIVGLFLTYVFRLAMTPVMPRDPWTRSVVELVVGLLICYSCVSLLLQTREDFRFIIPYVEFSKEVKGLKPFVLDTSVVIDGRIADVVETKVLDSQLIMPRFVLSELQAIADSSDRLRRSRGRRGLDILNRLRSNTAVDLQIYDRELPEFEGHPVDLKLVLVGKTSRRQSGDQRLQSQQGRQVARRRRHQLERAGQRAEAGVFAR